MEPKNVIFLNNLIWRPELPNFKDKYELFSSHYQGLMIHYSSGHKTVTAGRFNLISVPYSKVAILRYIRYLFTAFKHAATISRVDYIITYDPTIFGLIGLVTKYLTKGKLILEVNVDPLGGATYTTKGILLRAKLATISLLMRFVGKRADGVKFVSKQLERDYAATLSCRNVATFFSFISIHVFRRERCKEGGYVLFVGEPYKLKGVDVLIKAFKEISNEYPHLRLKIIGHCPDRSNYDALASGCSRIEFQQGTPYDDIIQYFEKCDFLVLPSRTEGIPRVIAEAMACGKAVIGSNVGGIPQMIEDGVNGFIFESENYRELADRMRVLIEDEDLRKRLGESGYKFVHERYSPESYISSYRNFLEATC